MWVKICGISTMRAAVAAYEAGADAVGFVFAESRRQVNPDRAQSLIMGIPPEMAKVGVFVNEAPEVVNQVARYVGLTHVQLHGEEPPTYLDEIELPVIKAFRVKDVFDLEQLPAYQKAAGLLLDPFVPGQAGGTGQQLDLTLFKEAQRVLGHVTLSGPKEPLTPGRPKLILAGGLHPGNIVAAIREANPGGVDVSSGVETDGQKDLQKVYDFTDLAKEAFDL